MTAEISTAASSRKTTAHMSANSRPAWTPLLSVIIPVYNEVETIYELLRRVARTPFPKEIFVVDDNSTDGTRELLRELPDIMRLLDGSPLSAPCRLKALFHATNQGKGKAVRTALRHVTGSFVLIQGCRPRIFSRRLSPTAHPAPDRPGRCGVWIALSGFRGRFVLLAYGHQQGPDDALQYLHPPPTD